MKREYDSLVWSEEQLVNFYNTFFNETSPFHTGFFCLAARKKYMTPEQKASINLGDTCMMSKTILKESDVNKFLSKVYQADASASFYTDRDGNFIPRSCMVYYVNINRTNVLKAMKEFKMQLSLWDYDVATTALFDSEEKRNNIGKQLKTAQNNLLKSFQEPKNTEGEWFDIDCDVNGLTEDHVVNYKKKLCELYETDKIYFIHTHGGCHVVFSKRVVSEYNERKHDELSNGANNFIKKESILNSIKGLIIKDFPNQDVKEIKFNQNAAIPMPGTLQGEHQVKMI